MDEMKTMTHTLSLPLILFATLAACAPTPEGELGAEVEAAASGAPAVAPEVQLALSRLAISYGTALDAIGDGDLDRGTALLRGIIAPQAEVSFAFPPGYEALDFGAVGPDELAQAVHGTFQALGFVRTQHHVTNVVVERTAPNAATMTSYITAPHVFANNSVLNITARFRDQVRYRNDRWLIVHREVVVISLTQQPAFVPGA
jgi:hypothetical protein